ncbi:MAG: patatin [Arcobacter sp.]|nr:MAG: patatin [Arcobacter sp.]
MKLALVLSGGGAKGAFHLGMLRFFEEENIKIEAYSGTSIGSVIACSHASGVSAKEQFQIFKSKEIKKALKFNYFKKGLLKIDHNNKIINELLPLKNLEDLSQKVYVNAYDIKGKKMHYFSQGNIIDLCMASSALIPIFKAISYKKMQLIDGGFIDNLAVKPFLKQDFSIFSSNVFPKSENKKSLYLNPVKYLQKKIFRQVSKNMTVAIENSDYYFTSLQLNKYKILSFKDIEPSYALGYKEAQNQLRQFLKDYRHK